MTGQATDRDYVGGEARAELVLERIQLGIANPDEALHGLTNAASAVGQTIFPTSALRGYLRRLQKAIEAAR